MELTVDSGELPVGWKVKKSPQPMHLEREV
jgi:hypothetical protein